MAESSFGRTPVAEGKLFKIIDKSRTTNLRIFLAGGVHAPFAPCLGTPLATTADRCVHSSHQGSHHRSNSTRQIRYSKHVQFPNFRPNQPAVDDRDVVGNSIHTARRVKATIRRRTGKHSFF